MNNLFSVSKLIHTFRLLIAISISLIINTLYKNPFSIWILITIIVIMFDQSNIGGVVQKSKLRTIATISASIFSAIIILLFNDNIHINYIAALIATFIYSTLYMDTNKNYIGQLGIVTICIILIEPHNGILNSLIRPMNILIGVMISIIVMRLIFPKYAKVQMEQLIHTVIKDIEKELLNLSNNKDKASITEDYTKHENNFMSNIIKFNRLIDELSAEPKNNKYYVFYKEIYMHLRRIYRLITIMYYNQMDNNYINLPIIVDHLKIIANSLNNILVEKKDNLYSNIKTIDVGLEEIRNHSISTAMCVVLNHIIYEVNQLNEIIHKLTLDTQESAD
ncbi:MAG TPA: FUSC family protein [Burkholderiales bacterium]|nr:FUSC family protein [Burkholderiales bacterium]